MITFQGSGLGVVQANPMTALMGLGQDATAESSGFFPGVDPAAPALTSGLFGVVLGATAVTGISYAGLRFAGTKRPGKGSMAFGAGALLVGMAGIIASRHFLKNPPANAADAFGPIWFYSGIVAAT